MENKKLVPEIRFPEFDGEWNNKKIKDLTEVTVGGTPSTSKPEYWNGNIAWLSSGELNNGIICTSH